MKPSLEKMSIEQLEKEIELIMQERAKLREKQATVVEVLNKRRQEEGLKKAIAEVEQKHGVKVQTIAPKGIEAPE